MAESEVGGDMLILILMYIEKRVIPDCADRSRLVAKHSAGGVAGLRGIPRLQSDGWRARFG